MEGIDLGIVCHAATTIALGPLAARDYRSQWPNSHRPLSIFLDNGSPSISLRKPEKAWTKSIELQAQRESLALSSDCYLRLSSKLLDAPESIRHSTDPVSYTHLRAHETGRNLVCRLLL